MGHFKSKVIITPTETEKVKLDNEKSHYYKHDYKNKQVNINETPEEIVEYVQINVSPINRRKTHKFQKRKQKLKRKYAQVSTMKPKLLSRKRIYSIAQAKHNREEQNAENSRTHDEKPVRTTSNTSTDFCDKCEVLQADKTYFHELLKTAFDILCEEIIFNLRVAIILITDIMLETSSVNTPEDLQRKKRLKDIIKELHSKKMVFKRLQMKDPLQVNFTDLMYHQSKRGEIEDIEANCVTDCDYLLGVQYYDD